MFLRIACRGALAVLGCTALVLTGSAAHGATRGEITVFAHRGASAYAPENTAAAVRLARRLGASWVENDVQRTSDGHLVVVHDTTLSRTTDAETRFPDRSPWRVADFTLAEIESLDAGTWFGPGFCTERILTLGHYLGLLDRTGQGLLLEIKAPELYPGIEAQLAAELAHHGWLDEAHVDHRLVVQSFSTASLRAFHLARPDVRTGYLGAPAPADLPEYAAFADEINPPYQDATADYVTAVHEVTGAHGRPLEVNAWTVNDAETTRRLVAAGADGLITNAPDTVLRAAGDGGRARETEEAVAGAA
jgi:glycerophosphoryl diester phosphodiesterase